MKGREKFIVVVAALMLAYLVYAVISGDLMKNNKKPNTINGKITTPVQTQSSTLKSIKMLKELKGSFEKELAVISKKEKTLEVDPFSSFSIIETSQTAQEEDTVDISKLIYSSYLSAEDKKVAVVNNFEYLEGEEVINLPFIVKKIYPDFIIVTSTKEKREYKINFINLTKN